MKSYDSKQWDKLVPGSSLGKKKAIRPRIGSKIRLDKEAAKKTEKLTLKELIAKGRVVLIQMTIHKMLLCDAK
jgi:hypothetical protein